MLVAEWDGRVRQTDGADPVRGIRIAFVIPSLAQAKRTGLVKRFNELRGKFFALRPSWNAVDMRVDFPGGSTIQFFSQEQRENLRGARIDVVVIDECDDIDCETFDGAITPWLSEPVSLKGVLMGGTPRRGRMGLLYRTHRRALEGEAGHRSFHATYRDAPKFVDNALVLATRGLLEREGNIAVFEREWECNFDAGEGLVYSMFSPDVHVREPDSRVKWNDILVGVDHGWNDPGVFEVCGVAGTGRDAVVHVLEETHQRERTESWWTAKAVEVLVRYPQAKWFMDPSRPDRIAAFKRVGCHVLDTDNSIEPGVSAVANRMALRVLDDGAEGQVVSQFYVHPQCKELIAELGLYRRKRDPRNPDKYLDAIVDRDNHCLDAVRYAIMGRFGKPQMTRSMGQDPLF